MGNSLQFPLEISCKLRYTIEETKGGDHLDAIQQQRIDRLREKTGCSFDKAQEALSQGDGSLLHGLLYLEEKGHARIPPDHGFYSTKTQHSSFQHLSTGKELEASEEWKEFQVDSSTPPSLLTLCKEELLLNYLEVWYKKQMLGNIPVVCLFFLMPLSYGSVFPVLVAPMFVGVYYQFSRKESFLAEFNSVLRRISRSFYHFAQKIFLGKKHKRSPPQS